MTLETIRTYACMNDYIKTVCANIHVNVYKVFRFMHTGTAKKQQSVPICK